MHKLRKILFVLGSHRSGTSALARVLNLRGAYISKKILPPQKNNNETGFWESSKLVSLNIMLSEILGINWSSIAALEPDWMNNPNMLDLKFKARNFLRSELAACGESKYLLLKDPRLCVLMPFWLEQVNEINCIPLFVFSLRSPLEVANSLGRRDKLDISIGLAIWLRAYLDAEYQTRGYDRVFVEYSQLINNWRSSMLFIEKELALAFPRQLEHSASEIENFLHKDMRHNVISDQRLMSREVPNLVHDAHKTLLRFCSEPENLETLRNLDILRSFLADVDFFVRAHLSRDSQMQTNKNSDGDLKVLVYSMKDEVRELIKERDALASKLARLENVS